MELYNEPGEPLRGRLHRLAGHELHAGDDREGDTVKLLIGDVRLPDDKREAVAGNDSKTLIAGIRPEHFEDAGAGEEARDKGSTFTAKIEVLESMGSELFAHFSGGLRPADRVARAARAGRGRRRRRDPDGGRGGPGIAAWPDPQSGVSVGEEAELADATGSSSSIPARPQPDEPGEGPAATGGDGDGQSPVGRDPEPAVEQRGVVRPRRKRTARRLAGPPAIPTRGNRTVVT